MAGTNAHAAKLALRNLIRASASFTDVQVEYAYPGLSHAKRECVFFDGGIEGPVDLSVFRAGGALPRNETLVTNLHIEVQAPGVAPEDNEARAVVLGTAFETVIASNPTLGDLANLKIARISSFAMGTDQTDELTLTRVSYGITFNSENK